MPVVLEQIDPDYRVYFSAVYDYVHQHYREAPPTSDAISGVRVLVDGASRRQAPTNRSACRATADSANRLTPPRFHCRARFAIDLAPANRLALVVRLLAFDERERDLHPPFFKYIRSGTSVKPFSATRPVSFWISWRCSSSLRWRRSSWCA